MPHLEIIRHRPPSLWHRASQAVRSLTLGPFSPKDPALARLYGGSPSTAGVTVTETTALTYAAVWQAVSLIAGDVGSLPLILYKRTKDGGKERYSDHPLYSILHDAPNPEMSSMVFRETLQAHLLTWGNAYAEIERDNGGRVAALWPLLPTQVEPFRDNQMRLKYRVGGERTAPIVFDRDEILHIPGLGWDGTKGYSPIHQARESLGLLAAAEKFGASFFGNGSTFGGTLEHPKTLGLEGQKNLRASLDSQHKGPEKAHRYLILEEGMKYTRFGVDPNNAQFLETRQFQIAEVARWFNLPLHKLREMEHSSVRANIEQEALDYYTSTLRPWLTRWEQEILRKLISPRERTIQFAQFLLEGVLRGDQKSRYDAYSVGRQWGWLSQNEIRAFENLNPIADGDVYLSPLNMVPSNRLDEVVDKQVEPTPAPVVAPAGENTETKDAEDRALLVAQITSQAVTIGELQARFENVSGQLSGAETAIEAMRATEAILRAEIETAATRSLEADAQYTSERERLEAQCVDLQRAADALLQQKTDAERDLGITTEQLKTSNERMAELRAELETSATKAIEADALHAVEIAEVRQELETGTAAVLEAIADTERISALLVESSEALAGAKTELEAAANRALDAETLHQSAVNTLGLLVGEADKRAADAESMMAALADKELAAFGAKQEADRVRDEALGHAATALERASVAEAERDAAVAITDAAVKRHAETLTAAITASRAVVLDAVARLARREAEKARSKRQTPEKLKVWAESFYDDHEADIWVDALTPVVAVHQALIGSDRPAEDVARTLVTSHMATSKRNILAVADSDPSEYAKALDVTLTRWETTRPAALADDFVREEIAYVRSIQ